MKSTLIRKSRFSITAILAAALSLAGISALAAPVASSARTFKPHSASLHALDAQISSFLNTKYAKHAHLRGVRARTSDRVVTLNGSVPDYRAFLEANHIARQVSSVNGVIDHIAVRAPYVPDASLQKTIDQRLVYSRLGMGQIFNGISTKVNHGVVTLSGQVVDYPSRDSALDIVDDTTGVKGVVDHVKVAPLSPFDNQIRFEAARAIYRNPELSKYALDPAHPIRILVNNGHVTLWGVVDSKMDKQLAFMAVNGLPNVFSVKNDLVVK